MDQGLLGTDGAQDGDNQRAGDLNDLGHADLFPWAVGQAHIARTELQRRNTRGGGEFAEIGEAAGLSASAAKWRLDRLVATRAIQGFTALIDTQALGWRTEAYVEIYCKWSRLFNASARAPSSIAPKASSCSPD